MKKTTFLLAACLLAASCTDGSLTALDNRLSDDETALQTLGDRISGIEATMLQINTDVRSILVLRGALTVSKAEGSDADGWTLTFGDGRIVTVPPQGPKGNAPVISMDADGYWMAEYGKGAAYILDVNGNKVNQLGKGPAGRDADCSPILGVTEDGYWKISYDGGEIWMPLLDPDGSPVPTRIEIGETLFSSVKVLDGKVKMILKSGENFELPLVKNFICSIQGASSIEQFTSGQTKDYTLLMDGILDLAVTCPNGWKAVVSGTTLSVTAPVITKVYFDSEEYVSIYAISTDGHSVVSSMKVAITE